MSESESTKFRVGLIVPSVQVVTEPLYYEVAGDRLEFFTTRLYLQGSGVQDLIAMEESLPRAIQELGSARVDVLAYCCTGSGAIRGYEQERELCRQVEDETGIPMVTTMLSVVDALREVGAQRIALASPYTEEINRAEISYFAQNGFEIVSDVGQNIKDGFVFSQVTPQEIAKFALKHWDSRADALFMSCMNWQAMRIVAEVESQIGKPVVTSHSATLWNMMRALNEKSSWTHGQLLAM